ncbi:transposase [Bacillus licheniformis]|uniref:transposase n=1 Tax=Bacillus licheniformis TaxID=1402 RepID=UPI002DB749FF|nr:transposase [Bacillus licheniformis]MEC1351679.1 helix-turn-helix domain-containing protein [Bacillus licheniformis]
MAKGKYADWITDEGLIKIEGWARDGLTDEDISRNIGISRATLYEWKKKHPDISDALKRGKEVVDRQVENALLKKALGYTYNEDTYVHIGEDKMILEKRVVKEVQPDTGAAIFWLKNRRPDIWRKESEIKDRQTEAQTVKTKAETEFVKARTKLLKGSKGDTALISALVDLYKQQQGEGDGN